MIPRCLPASGATRFHCGIKAETGGEVLLVTAEELIMLLGWLNEATLLTGLRGNSFVANVFLSYSIR